MDESKTRLYKRLEFVVRITNQSMRIVSSGLRGDEGGVLRRQSDEFRGVNKCTVKWKHVSVPVLEAYGALGVHVFFVLSGFLITDLLLRERERTSGIDLPNFYLRRAFRIFPAAFVFLAIVTVLYWPEMHWTHLAAAVFYVANLDLSRPWIFGHLWSLSIEEQFYLLWPLALKRWHRYRVAILICVFVGTPVFRAILYAVKAHGPIVASLPVVADQLAIGCLLAIFAKRLPRIPGYLAPVRRCMMRNCTICRR